MEWVLIGPREEVIGFDSTATRVSRFWLVFKRSGVVFDWTTSQAEWIFWGFDRTTDELSGVFLVELREEAGGLWVLVGHGKTGWVLFEVRMCKRG